MNLNQIDTKNFILTLFKRDDGERILLGAGAYSFKDDLQHFQPNIIANDVIEKQGTDGQLLAGQVRRCQTQTFNGYIGDASTTRERTEDYRRQFIQFFRTNHFYTAIYILPNGDAIQRRNGYLVEAPSVPEQYQRFPEYSVGMQFEDLNYYTYNENDQGEETYAQTVDLIPEGNLTGGLTWDGDGVVWSDQGKSLDQVIGDTFQQSYEGKNLVKPVATSSITSSYDETTGEYSVSKETAASWPWLTGYCTLSRTITSGTEITISRNVGSSFNFWVRTYHPDNTYGSYNFGTAILSQTITEGKDIDRIVVMANAIPNNFSYSFKLQVELGSEATTFEPYVGGLPSPNQGYPQLIQTVTGTQTITINGTDYPLDLGDIELCELNDYQDYIWKDGEEWKVHKATKRLTFDASEDESWIRSGQSTSSVFIGALTNLRTGGFLMTSDNGALSKMPNFHFSTEKADGVFRFNKNAGSTYMDYLFLEFNSTKISTIEGFKDWLESNPSTLYAPMATATDAAITDQNLIAQLEAISEALKVGDRNISITATTGNLPAIIVTKTAGIGGAIWDASGGHSTNIITVGGLFAVQPVWKIVGPAETPVLENITDGTSLSYIGSIPEGQVLTIDSSNQTAYLDGANVKNNVRGTWQQFQPGDVTIRYSGANVTKASTLEWNEVVG